MARVEQLKADEMTARQRTLHDQFQQSRPHATLGGPFAVLLRTPDIAEPADRLVSYFRQEPRLGQRLIELIILLVVRDASAQYAWSVHEPNALRAGLTQQTIDAIRARQQPAFEREDERVLYDLVVELLTTKTASTATFERAKATFGVEGVIEAVSCTGFYCMVGFVLNVFDIPPRGGIPLT